MRNSIFFLLIFISAYGTIAQIIEQNDDLALVEKRSGSEERQDCIDTPSWINGHGHDCISYGSQWCENGASKPGQEWTLGATYNYPENNCCVCGKVKQGRCSNGDVKLEADGTPLTFWENQWMPICGHYFWDNQDGAKLFCKKMGYHSGAVSRVTGQKNLVDSFRIGKCNGGDEWESCSGGCNDYEVGGECSNNGVFGSANCDKDQEVKIAIECSGGGSIKTSSCKECNNEINTMTCSASSEYSDQWSCKNAIDGKSDTDWATKGQGTGAWIQLNFRDFYKVETIKIRHRSTGSSPTKEMFKDLSLEFSDGQKVDYKLNSVPFTTGLVWNEIVFTNNPVSDYVKITSKSVYSAINNGFSDIRVYGCAEDKNCVKWRQTGQCKADGPREPSSDKNCFAVIEDAWSGYCDCADGTKALEKGCNDHKFSTCNEACKKDVVYREPLKRGACATTSGGSTMYHERCQCRNEDIKTCKAHCDGDVNCKGFVGPTSWDACQWATTSDCPAGCDKYNKGDVGDILLDDELSSSAYPGCFVKLEANIPEDCEWNDWENGDCSQTCGGGTRSNTRTKKKEASHGGMCEGENTMKESCNTGHCPQIHCEWNDWSYGECSETCGTGTRINTRTKLVVEEHGGTCTGQSTETDECNTDPCPVDCEWDEWKVGECDKSCGGGVRTNAREAKKDAQHGGDECTGSSSATESCNVQECSVDCEWGKWVIGECSEECGGGVQINFREKIQEELFGGKTCDGVATQELDCNTNSCPVDCEWNAWDLGECSVTCGGGTRIDTRTKIIEENNGGTCDPMGSQREESCNIEDCPIIHCVWDDWLIGECSTTCSTGTRTNTRTKLVVEANGGTCTGQPTEIQECKLQECPVHCEWDEWKIGECSKTCGGGTQTKTRVEIVSADHGGNECDGEVAVTESCNVQECPVDCEWGEWVVGECSEECGDGVQVMTRTIQIEALFGGKLCDGESTIEEPCFVKACLAKILCQDKSEHCTTYTHYYGDRYCADTPANAWFVGEAGRYGCRQSCGLC